MYRYRLRKLLPILVLTPIAIPEILMGVSLLIFFVCSMFTLGLCSVALAHIAFCIGFVAIVVRSRLAGMDESLIEAARDCGATPWQAFRYVTLPLIMPGVIAGALMAFTLSIDDFVITFFTAGRGHGDAAAADLLDDQDRGDARGQRRVDAADAADAGADHHRFPTFAQPAALRRRGIDDEDASLLLLAVARARRRCPSRPPRTSSTCTTGTTTSRRRRSSASRSSASARSCRPTTRTTRSCWPSSRRAPRATTCSCRRGNAVQALIKGGRLKPLDKAQLPNLKNIDPVYLNTPFDPGNKYSVPYAMSTTILGYNDEKMKELGLPTDTWAVIFDPKYLEKVKGRVTVLDSANELFAAALKYLGYSANDVDPKHWDEARRRDQEGQAVLGRVQRVVVHQGADGRQHLARARLFERHLPGRTSTRRRPGGKFKILQGDAEGRRGARRRQHGDPQDRAAARPRATSSSTSCSKARTRPSSRT